MKAHKRFKGNVSCFVLSRQTELFHVLVFHFECFEGAYLVFRLSAKKKKSGGWGRWEAEKKKRKKKRKKRKKKKRKKKKVYFLVAAKSVARTAIYKACRKQTQKQKQCANDNVVAITSLCHSVRKTWLQNNGNRQVHVECLVRLALSNSL